MELSALPSLSTLSSLLARIAFTAVLLIAAFLLLREAFRMWNTEPLTLGELTYVEAGEVKPEKGAGLVRDIIDRRNALRDAILRLVAEQRTVQSSSSASNPSGIEVYSPSQLFSGVELDDLKSAADSAPRIELKIQGNDIGSLLTSLQRWISPVNALKVSVFKRGEQFSYLLDWPNDDLASATAFAEAAFRADVFEEEKLGASIGCRILWLELAASASRIAETPPDVFCRWAEARMLFEAAVSAESGGWPEAKATERYEKGITILGDLPETVMHFPPLQNLYALLLGATGRPGPEVDHAWSNLKRVTSLSPEPPLPYEPPSQVAAAPDDRSETGAGRLLAFKMESGAFSRVTVAAVVADRAGNRFLVVPDYAMTIAGATEAAADVWAASSLGGPVGRRVGSFAGLHEELGIALVALEPDLTASNQVRDRQLEAVGSANTGDRVHLISLTHPDAQSAKIARIATDEGPLRYVTDQKISQGGDGGAPVVDDSGVLVAMGYAGSQDRSELVALGPVFDKLELTLSDTGAGSGRVVDR